MKIYNECFYKMRKALEIEPINFYYDYSQIKDKIKDIKEKICVGFVMHWRFRIPYFKRHLRHE